MASEAGTTASEATTALEIVLLATWTCLVNTPLNGKNTLFARFFSTLPDLEVTAAAVSLDFCDGLLEVLQSTTPPSNQFVKSLPTDDTSKRWGIYVILMEKPNCRPKLYIGSGTSSSGGVRSRLKQYDDGFLIPRYVQKALDDDYEITHKGLLCWIPKPSASLAPVSRLLFLALEATFTYMFWTLKAKNGDYGMGSLCLWDRRNLPYDGLCSHCSLNEGIHGNFDLSSNELEKQAAEKEQKFRALKAQNATNHHYKQMATNYHAYISKSTERVTKSRANNPGRDKQRQADRIERALAAQDFYCNTCNINLGTRQRLNNHLDTPKHLRKVEESADTPFKCVPCNLAYHNKSNLTRHEKSQRHIQNAAAQSSLELD